MHEATRSHSLPEPGPDALALSERLRERIGAEIAANGDLRFSRYMEMALYEPGLGYYSAGSHKFGEAGDFVTAPEISPLFSSCLATQCAEILAGVDGATTILEVGAGSGVMAADMLARLATLDRLPDRYLILEVSAELRERQRAHLAEHAREVFSRIEWLDRLPREGLNGCIVGNEVLDALPVDRFVRSGGRFRGLHVGLDDDRLVWRQHELTASQSRQIERLFRGAGRMPAEGYCSEWCPGLASWIASMAACLGRGAMLLIDYGLPADQYYLAERTGGTLMCHYRHRAHDDVFLWPGLQDITAWVDFSAVAGAGRAAGLTVAGFTTQAHFLLALGLHQRLAEAQTRDPVAQARLARQVRQLVMPGEMGERFKVIALTRDIDIALRGFAQRSFIDSLSMNDRAGTLL